jgi:hypothetical protein
VPFLGLWRVPEGDHSGLVSLVVLLVGFSGILAGLTGYIVGQFNWLNRQGFGVPNRLARSNLTGNGLTTSVEISSQSTATEQENRENGGSV